MDARRALAIAVLAALLAAPSASVAPGAAVDPAEAMAAELAEAGAAWQQMTRGREGSPGARVAPAGPAPEVLGPPARLAAPDLARPHAPPAPPPREAMPGPALAETVQVPAPASARTPTQLTSHRAPAPLGSAGGESELCSSPLNFTSSAVFLVATRVPPGAPRMVPGVPLAPNLVHADVPLVDATGDPTGLDLVLQVTADLTLQRITLRIDRPPTDALPPPLGFRPLPALDVRIIVPLSAGAEPGLASQGCLREFVYAGYRYDDPAGQPDRFAVSVKFSSVGDDDETLELDAELERPPSSLTVFGGLFAAETATGPRARSFDAEATLRGLPAEFEANVRLRSVKVPGANSTQVDWRASAALDAAAVALTDRDGEEQTTTEVQVQDLPRRVGLTLRTGATLAATYDASAGIPDLRVARESAVGPATVEHLALHATQVPAHAIVAAREGNLTYGGDTPLGVVELVRGTWGGPFPTLPGEHLVVADDGQGRSSISARIAGLRRMHYSNDTGLAVEAHVGGGAPFTVILDRPGKYAEVSLDPLPREIDLRSDLAATLRYRASDVIDVLTAKVEAAPLFVDVQLTAIPRSVDVNVDTGLGDASVVLDEPLGSVVAHVLNTSGFANQPYKRVRVHAEDIPGLAANWTADGRSFAIQALPPGAQIGEVEVELSATDGFLGFADPQTHYALLRDFPGQQQASLRVLDFAAASVDLRRGIDLRWLTGVQRPLVVSTDGPTETTQVEVLELPASLRFTSDLNTTFAYNASTAIDHLDVLQVNKTTSNETIVHVDQLPPRFIVLLDPEGRAATFNPGPGHHIGGVEVELRRPDGLGEGQTKVRHVHVTVQGIPALGITWGSEGPHFATDGRALALAKATISTQLPAPALAAGVHQDSDYVVVSNGTEGDHSLTIHAQIRGLRAAGASFGNHRLLGDVQLAAPQHFDFLFLSRFESCLERRVELHVDPLPSFNVTTDLNATVHFHASEPIRSIDLLAEHEEDDGGQCKVLQRTHLTVDDLPRGIDIAVVTKPLLARYRADVLPNQELPDVFLDLLDLMDKEPLDLRRINVTVRDIPGNLAVGLNNATTAGLFEADQPITEVQLRAGNEAQPQDLLAGRDEAHVVAIHDASADTGKVAMGMRISGLRSASFALGQKAVAGEVRAQQGELYVDVATAKINTAGSLVRSAVRITLDEVPDHVKVSTDGSGFARIEASAGMDAVEVHACDFGSLDTCTGTLADVVLKGVPRVVDIAITGPGLDLAFGGDRIDSMALRLEDPLGLFGKTSPGATKQIAVELAPVPEGKVHFGDPHDIDIALAETANLHVYVTNNLAFDGGVPGSLLQEVIADFANPFYADNHVYLFKGLTFVVAEGQIGPDDEIVDVRLGSAAGEGVRSLRISSHTNPSLVDLALEVPSLTLAKWERHFFEGNLANVEGIFPPEMFLSMDAPPSRLRITSTEAHPTHLVQGYDTGWRHDDYWPFRVAPHVGVLGSSPGATQTTVSIDTLGTGTGGQTYLAAVDPKPFVRFSHPPTGDEITPTPSAAAMFFGHLPSTLTVKKVTDPRVFDTEVGRDGSYSSTDLTFSGPVALLGFQVGNDEANVLHGTVSRIFTDSWTDYDQDTCDVGVSIPNAWLHLRIEGTLTVIKSAGDNNAHVSIDWVPEGPFLDLSNPGDSSLIAHFVDYSGTLWVHMGEEACDNGQACNEADGDTIGIAQPIPIILWRYPGGEDDCEGLVFPDMDPGDGDVDTP